MLTPVSSTGYATDVPTAGFSQGVGDHGNSSMISPHSVGRSLSGPSAGAPYAAVGGSRVLSPPVKSDMSQHGPSDLRVSVPSYEGLAGSHGSQWQSSQQHMTSSQYRPHQGARASWDLSTYLDSSPASAVSGSAQHTLGYGRPSADVSVGADAGKLQGAQGSQ